MKFDHILLALLAMRPWTGYDLHKWMRQEGRYLRPESDQSQIYRLLARLEEQGWATHELDERDGRPHAKVYRLTGEGREEVLRWARSPYVPSPRLRDPEFTARFVFAGMLDPAVLRDLLVTELEARKEQVRLNRGRDRALTFDEPLPEVDPDRARLLWDLVHQRGMDLIDSWIEWLEQTLARLDDEGVTP
ncbi:PadR family transcriptional regulator [Bailinhaonella thermotolerans]|uniref:PadR family transcriptional regulator n=1 Tax=Bailinhaonella thermotolerans TaxID=1070861 RepID=A0A3A4APQ1_9ACTN|nr:PadR family transcriptional regulator [Bailinhaonella thermotolerans]RJL23258.1 PadR family transcriptional regulator [Bailinhaonella thermotolerans]